MYVATGDGDRSHTRSIGVLKSTDHGVTWHSTGLIADLAQNLYIRKIIINPVNHLVVLAGTSVGVQRTNDGGISWQLVTPGNFCDLEFKPGDPNVVYASGTTFKLSTDGGVTWNQISNGIPTTGVQRMTLAVTPAAPDYVYVIASQAAPMWQNGFQGCYRSTTSGTSFTKMSSSPNLCGYSSTGNDTGGQGWYALCAAASPQNKDELIMGCVNVWKSTDGGSTWSIFGHWTGSGAPFTHADHHDLEYSADGTIFNANDGTIFKRTGTSWTEISGKMNISQIYKIGTSSLTSSKWITGHQDNGTAVFSNNIYTAALGADGMDCFIDRTNDNVMFGSIYDGSLEKSTNGGASWSGCTSGLTGTGGWVTPWKQDPVVAARLYTGYTNMFVSNNLAGSWSALGPLGGSDFVTEFAISKSNNNVLYVLKPSGVFKTINGGTSWTKITGNLPIANALPTFVTINPNDENNAWITLSGYSSGNKVYMTNDGGATWINISGNLPNIPANCSVYQNGTNDRIFIGMDVGVYFREKSSLDWTLYNYALPNVPVADMEISPAAPDKIRAATFGRGVWEVDISSIILPVTGNDFAKNFTFNLFPNPANTNVTINVQLFEKADLSIEVIDNLGRPVAIYEDKNADGLMVKKINTQSLSNGIYSVSVKAKGINSVKLLSVIH
jgi:hypothetical protein